LPSGFHKGDVEAYCHGRYFTFTGNIYQNLQTIHHRQDQLTTFWNDFSGKANLEKQSHTARVEYTNLAGTIDAKTVLRRALRSKNGEKIQQLLNDERLEHHTSDSERDLALCSHLTFYCGNVPDDEVIKIVDEIVRNHPVYRKKWDTIRRPADDATYGQMTIEKAIEGSTARYLTHVERNLSETEMVVENMERLGLKTQDIIEAAYDGQKGCANLFALMNRGHFCYDHADRDWYQFNCHYWKIENIGEPIKRVDGVQMFFKRVSAEIDAEITLLKQKE
jgi:primase-polymerase (primpol)-like protein